MCRKENYARAVVVVLLPDIVDNFESIRGEKRDKIETE